MSSKEKPTLGGTRIKTRKRNIAVPLNPSSFADAIVQVYQDQKGDLDVIAKTLESSDLDFNRYGDTFFEVIFTGHHTQPGGLLAEEGASEQEWNVLTAPGTKAGILPYVNFIQKLIRRRPFLIKNLENLMRKLMQSLELYGPEDRLKVAIFASLTFSQKLGLLPDMIFSCLLNDALVAKGTVLAYITDFFDVYLQDNSLDDLVQLLKRGKVEDRLLEFFPMQKRTPEAFNDHFKKVGLDQVVDYNQKKVFDIKLKELRTALSDMILAGESKVSDAIDLVKLRRKEASLPDVEVVRTLWDGIMDAVEWSGKNQQQNSNLAIRQIKGWGKLLGAFATTGKLEMELLYKIQIHCYEDAKLMKIFPEIVRLLYEMDVLAEDTLMTWYRKGTNPKGRQVFVKALEPFIKWLEEAEEEEDE